LYRDGLGSVLWDLSTQTDLAVRFRAGAGNQSSTFWIMFQDVHRRRLAFSIPLNSTSFTTILKSLTQPDFADADFSLSQVVSVDLMGDYDQSTTTALALELDDLKVLGPAVGPRLTISRAGANVILSWPANGGSTAVL